jgi:hypothetical protein
LTRGGRPLSCHTGRAAGEEGEVGSTLAGLMAVDVESVVTVTGT